MVDQVECSDESISDRELESARVLAGAKATLNKWCSQGKEQEETGVSYVIIHACMLFGHVHTWGTLVTLLC